MRLACPLILSLVLALGAESAQWFLPVYVRPERVEPGSDISGEVGARDDDRNGTNTWATKALTRTCAPEGGCAGVSSAAAAWSGFPGGYRARKLIVHWRASSTGALFGGTAEVRAIIEYSNGGQSWTTLDRFTGGEGPLLTHAQAAEAILSPSIDTAALKVRGRLEVEMRSCPNTECPAALRNPSNQSGQIWISDIRLEVDNPRLTASRERARKGDQVLFRVDGAPGAVASRWTFTGVSGAVIERADGRQDSWSLIPGESGTATVTVRLRGQPQLEGRPFELSKAVQVQTRR